MELEELDVLFAGAISVSEVSQRKLEIINCIRGMPIMLSLVVVCLFKPQHIQLGCVHTTCWQACPTSMDEDDLTDKSEAIKQLIQVGVVLA